MSMLHTLKRLFRHSWLDADDTRRAIPDDMVQRLMQRVQASEQRHSGEVRICVEAALPASYIWRNASARERAVMMFSKLRVWDTARNNGVLIYLLLAERAIEIVADRGLNEKVSAAQWQTVAQHMAGAFAQNQYENGLTQALEEVSALLVQHYAVPTGSVRTNELPDAPVRT